MNGTLRIGVMLSMPGEPSPAAAIVTRAQQAESAGFASAWLPQVSGLDAMTVLALAGSQTNRIELGTAVVPTYPRHPSVVAMQALTVQQVSGGRFTLGIGLSHRRGIEGALGLDYSRPIPHMREYLTVLNGLLSQRRTEFHGELYSVATQVSVAEAQPPQVLVAALGPDMLRLCGRLADGTITWMGGVDFLRDTAVPLMTAAAASAGRPAPRFVAMVPVLLSQDVAEGRTIINAAYGNYGQIPSYRATLDRGGAKDPADVAVIGHREDIEAGLTAFSEAGVTDFVAAIPQAAATADATYGVIADFARAAANG